MLVKITAVCVVLCTVVSGQKEIDVKACDEAGGGKLHSVIATPCDSDPCQLEKKSTVRFGLKYISDQDSPRLELSGTAIGIFGLKKSISGLEKDFCKVIQCPVEKGKEYSGVLEMNVPNTYFTRYATVQIEIVGDHGLSACINFPVELTPSRT